MSTLARKDNIVLLSLFAKTGERDGCFIWQGADNGEYGKISYKGKPEFTHRVTYRLCIGDITDGMDVSHTCNNKLCINPLHLYLSNKASRQKRLVKNGEWKNPPTKKGSNHKRSKLNEEKAREIYLCVDKTRAELAEKYGVSKDTIKSVKLRRTWMHATKDLVRK